MPTSLDIVEQCERALLSAEVRGDRTRLERLLHPDFVEIGASGRHWTRSDMIEALLAEPSSGDLKVHDLRAASVADGVVLVTYRTERAAAAARRSSLWVRLAGRWVVRFHQGTPLPPPA